MERYFIPYLGSYPATLSINGHKLLVVSSDPIEIQDSLGLFGADSVRSVEGEGSRAESRAVLEELAEEVDGGVVIAPEDVGLHQTLHDLEEELPWIQ